MALEGAGAGIGVGLRLASTAFQPLVKALFRPGGPGAGMVDKPVRVSSLVSFRGEQRTLTDTELRKLSEELVRRAVRDMGPHDALSEDEAIEATDLLARSLTRLGDLDMDDVQAVNLGHKELARKLLSAHGGDTPAVSTAAHSLHGALLERACLHILHFFTQRSTFVTRTLVEQSRLLEEVIRLLRAPSDEDAAFEGRYAAYIQEMHSRLTIYGLDLDQERDWPLDDAYLSLEVRRDGRDGRDEGHGELDAALQRAERALSRQSRVLLRGLAGSGKTTLVQWLAVTAARQDAGDGMTHLLGRVPFVLPMRTLTRDGARLPAPEQYLAAVDCALAGAQPHGWIDRVLRAGRGLLLVDGIDEIPEREREVARRWARGLDIAYPGNVWVVTTRPTAVPEDWLASEGFSELTLAPMRPHDVQAFIHRWHGAAQADPGVEDGLLDLISSRADLATLATNPLMCAMICALHRERRGHLPRGRKALYDAALMMLLERRDRERPDRPRTAVDLDAETQISLLQKLAFWLINNGRSEMTRDVAVSLVEQALPLIRQGGPLGGAEGTLRHLIERSGVLRQPAADAVDFVHRTFQDYLGAREIVEWQHFPALVERAHEDQWEDVVRMAVAHAHPPQCAEFLTALIKRGDKQEEHRVRLHLLAMACLEHATQLRPDVRRAVQSRARKLIPPRTPREAAQLAWGGPFVLELLPGPEELTVNEARAVVRVTTRIGSDAALSRLRAFRDHGSPEVQAELAMDWQRFNSERYAEEILTHLPPGTPIHCSTREQFEALARLDGVEELHLNGTFSEREIVDGLASRHPLASLAIYNNDDIHDLRFLRQFEHLTALDLSFCGNVSDLSPLTDTPIRRLTLMDIEASGLSKLTALRSLDITGSLVRDLSDLPQDAPLERLMLHLAPDISAIGRWPDLRCLDLWSFPGELTASECQALAALPHLKELRTTHYAMEGRAIRSTRLPAIEAATIYESRRTRWSPALKHVAKVLPNLVTLDVDGSKVDLGPLAALPRLRTVRILRPGAKVTNVPPHVEVISPPTNRY